ncbi:sensor histidine kinase [Microbacterium resistens]|uniref:sensor histidine kinase n=1 Tax=Microbacterium resistens TaxID=156977 RepID=UPI001C581083|nr:histidine kinase [Microbacterium resistens]MBW1638018.1 sensor histidine kinase [Microbacterium resistens]
MNGPRLWSALVRSPWRFLGSAWPWRALLYLLTSAALAVILLPVVVLTLLLVPLWALPLGALERRRTRILGFPVQRSAHVRLEPEQRHIWLSVRLSEAATWREVGALLLDVLLGGVSLALLFAEAVALVLLVAVGATGIRRETTITLWEGGVVSPSPSTWWLTIPLGLAALGLFGYLNAALAGGHASLLRFLCGPREEELTRNVERLTRSRIVLVQALEDERRRIERDLHDGVQQELVTVAARLGMVGLELEQLQTAGADADAALQALTAAQQQTEHALGTLRRTVRGIHPAVLTDHGLRAALSELADRTPVPMTLDLTGLDARRLPAPVETAAYYLVTEAVTNAAKHTASARVDVTARWDAAVFALDVVDQGPGGVAEDAGTGLRGLRERVETIGGEFQVSSPRGGPTRVGMRIPTAREDTHAHPVR